MDDLTEYNAVFKLMDFTLLQNRLTAFSLEKKLLAIANGSTIYLYSTKTKKQLAAIKSHDGDITQLFFVPNSQHILTATTHGRVIIYNYKDARYNVRLYSWVKRYKTQLPTRISAFAFKKHLLALGTSDGKVTLINLNSYAVIDKFSFTNAAISTLCFSDKYELIVIDAHGEIFVHDLQGVQKLKSISTHLSKTRQLLHISKSDFLLINSNKDSLTLFDIKSCKIVRNNYLTFHKEISYIELTKERNLLVVLQNREIIHITLQNRKNLDSLRLHNMVIEAYALVEKNPQLLDSKEYKELEKIYKIKYLNAVKALQNSDEKRAQQLLETCTTIKSKQEEIKLLFIAYKHYERFQSLAMQKMYAPAYALSTKYPPLQYSKEYKVMEKAYKKAYTNAQKQMLLFNDKKAKELLSPYLSVVSKKESINLILKYNQDFLSFLEAIKQNNYTQIKRLLTKHPLFTKIPPYADFLDKLYSTLEKINTLLNAADIEEAQRLMESLKHITLVEEELAIFETKMSIIKELLERYAKNQFKECYELLDTHPELFLELKLANMLEKHWNKLMHKCEKYALYGHMKGVKKTLKELMTTKSRTKRVGGILRVAFIVEIENHIVQQQFQSAENFIYSYIDIFGFDTDLQRVMHEYEKKSSEQLAIIADRQTRVARDAWLQNKLVVT